MASENCRILFRDNDFGETTGDMAALAIIPKFAAVAVVPAMAIDAFAADLRRVAGAPVAGGAYQPVMPSCQWKMRLPVMVERPHRPIDGVVAGATLRRGTERPRMLLVLVTIRAGGSCRAVGSIFVARTALETRMTAEQWETRQRVVESDLACPVLAVVTARAVPPQTTRVFVIFPVARDAGGFQL